MMWSHAPVQLDSPYGKLLQMWFWSFVTSYEQEYILFW